MTQYDYWQHNAKGHSQAAISACEAVLAFEPNNSDAMACREISKWKLGGDSEPALRAVRRALKDEPDSLHMMQQLAMLYTARGETERARAQYHKCLERNPNWAPALVELARIQRFSEIDSVGEGLLNLYARPDVPETMRRSIAFALGKMYDDLRQYDKAYEHFARGNADLDYASSVEREQSLERLWKGYLKGNGLAGKPRSTVNSDAPVYIVGLPRSGTTLLETTIGAHPRVHNCGELVVIGRENDRMIREVSGKRSINRDVYFAALDADAATKTKHAREILGEMAAAASKKSKILTDKLPHNLLHLPIISLLFPKARIIYARRHPLDCGVSIFQTSLSPAHPYSNDLGEIGKHYRFMIEMFELFRQNIDNPILDVSYELLVEDPQGQSARLFDFLGLDWNRSMMNRQGERKSIATASIWQARQPIHTRSKERWRNYEPWLGPMIEGMGGMDWIEAQAAESRRMGALPPAKAGN